MRLYRILLPILTLVTVAIVMVVPGRQGITDTPGVAKVDDIPAHAHARLARFLGHTAIILPVAPAGPLVQLLERQAGVNRAPLVVSLDGAGVRPMLGYSYRVFTVFKLPLAGYPEFGKVLYAEDGGRTRMVPLNADYLALLEREAGQPLGRNFIFPFWQFYWGWLFIAALVIAIVSWRREEADKRRESGIL